MAIGCHGETEGTTAGCENGRGGVDSGFKTSGCACDRFISCCEMGGGGGGGSGRVAAKALGPFTQVKNPKANIQIEFKQFIEISPMNEPVPNHPTSRR